MQLIQVKTGISNEEYIEILSGLKEGDTVIIPNSSGTAVHALDGVSLEIQKGEFVAIVGPSGSGKSTLMNIIGFLDMPTKGKYIFEGSDVSKLNDNELAVIRNRHIGFVFQNFNLLPKLTAFENVELPLTYAGNKTSIRRNKLFGCDDSLRFFSPCGNVFRALPRKQGQQFKTY